MSKKSKMMKRVAAKAVKSKDNGSSQKSTLGIKKEERKEVKKAALIKALAEKSVTVINPPPTAGGDTSEKKKRKRRNKKNKGASNLQPNREQQVAKDTSHSNPVTKLKESPKPVPQQQKLSSIIASNVPSGKGKKKKNRKKKNKTNPAAGQPAAIQQQKNETAFAEQQKKAPTDQLKTNQVKGVADNDQSASTESVSKKRIRRNRKRKAQVFDESTRLSAEQKSAKRSKLSPEMWSKNIHKTEEEASNDSETEPIHSDWQLKSDSKTESDIEQSSEDNEDLDTSEDDVDEEPIDLGEDSNTESSDNESDEEDNVTEDDLSIDAEETNYNENSESPGSSVVEDEERDDGESNNSDSEGEESNEDEEVDGLREFRNLGSNEVVAEEVVGSDVLSENLSIANGDVFDEKVVYDDDSMNSNPRIEEAEEGVENVSILNKSSSRSDSVATKVDTDEDVGDIQGSFAYLDSNESARSPNAEFNVADDTDTGDSGKTVKEEAKKVDRDEKSANAQIANTHVAKKKFSLSNKAEILREVKERRADFDSRCLYVSPIPADCTFDTIKKFIPKTKTCQFFMRPKSDKLRTYAFVELADAETASKERLSIMGRLFAGMSVRVESRASQQAYSASTVDDIDFSRVVVTGLVPTVNQTDLKAIFPTAESVRLSMLKNFNLGRAAVTFASDAVALDAFSQCHRYPLKGHPICVNFALKSGDKDKPTAPVAVDTSKSSPKTPEASGTEKSTQPTPERVGKVLIQQMKEESIESDRDLESTKKKLDAKLEKDRFGLTELIKNSRKKMDSDDERQEGDDDVEEFQDKSGDDEDDDDDESGQSDEEGSEVEEEDDDSDDDDDDDNASEEDLSDGSDEDDDEENVEAPDGDDSEGEEIDATLEEALKAHKASAKALKSPGAKRNWKAPANIKAGKKRPGSMPKVLPVPPSKSRK